MNKTDRHFQRVQTATMSQWAIRLGEDDNQREFLFQRFKDGFRRGVIPIEVPDPQTRFKFHTLTRQAVTDFLEAEDIRPRKLFPPVKPAAVPFIDLHNWLDLNADGKTSAPELKRRATVHFGVEHIPDSRNGWRAAWEELAPEKKLKRGEQSGK